MPQAQGTVSRRCQWCQQPTTSDDNHVCSLIHLQGRISRLKSVVDHCNNEFRRAAAVAVGAGNQPEAARLAGYVEACVNECTPVAGIDP